MRFSHSLTGILALAVFTVGCATTRVENKPLEKYKRGSGYGASFAKVQHGGKLRIVLAFSGGGTRARLSPMG